MKLVEKKCPNCGAGLKFDENDTNVTCEYCNKMYYLQKDEKKIAFNKYNHSLSNDIIR